MTLDSSLDLNSEYKNKIWNAVSPDYYIEINNSILEALESLKSYQAHFKQIADLLDADSKTLIEKIVSNIEFAIKNLPDENSLPSKKPKINESLSEAEEKYKKGLYFNIYTPILEARRFIKKLKANQSISEDEINNLARDFKKITKEIAKYIIFPEHNIRIAVKELEDKDNDYLKKSGITKTIPSKEEYHNRIFISEGRGEVFEYIKTIYDNFVFTRKTYDEIKFEIENISKNTDLNDTSKKPNLKELNSHLKENLAVFGNRLRTLKIFIKQTGIREFVNDEFSKSTKILAADFYINHLYDDYYKVSNEVLASLSSLSKFLNYESLNSKSANFSSHGNQLYKFYKLEKTLNDLVNKSAELWSFYSKSAREALVA